MFAWLATFLILSVRLYQMTLGVVIPKGCRFYPSCSEYFIQAVQKHGPFKGGCKGMWRICRCHPWNARRIDLP
jgi:uncharacterized protein